MTYIWIWPRSKCCLGKNPPGYCHSSQDSCSSAAQICVWWRVGLHDQTDCSRADLNVWWTRRSFKFIIICKNYFIHFTKKNSAMYCNCVLKITKVLKPTLWKTEKFSCRGKCLRSDKWSRCVFFLPISSGCFHLRSQDVCHIFKMPVFSDVLPLFLLLKNLFSHCTWTLVS